jgi:hypothetical protein
MGGETTGGAVDSLGLLLRPILETGSRGVRFRTVRREPAVVDVARRVRRAVARYLAQAPGTHILFFVITVTTLVLHGLDAQTATRILRHESTNLVQMSHDAPRVLFTSAFLTDQGRLLVILIEFTIVFVPVERWLGTYRWLVVFIAGHVGATLATTIGIWLQARGGSAGRDILTPVDVGISYGLVAAAAVLTYRFRRPVAWTLAVLLVLNYGAGVVRSGTFTDWGHLCALAIGFAIGPLVRRKPAVPAAPAALARSPRLTAAWNWVFAPRGDPHHVVRRRAATVIACVLLAGGAAIVGLLAADHDTTDAVPVGGEALAATVLGRPLGCGGQCRSVVVRYGSAGASKEALLEAPSRTLFAPGDHLVVRVDPRAPTHVLLVQPSRRVNASGLLGAIAIAAALGGVALLLLRPQLAVATREVKDRDLARSK